MEAISKKYFIKKNASIKTAMSMLNISPHKCLLVIDGKKKLLGTITDGDIRKSILKNSDIDRPISSFYNTKPIKVQKDKVDINEVKKLLKDNMFDLIPVVDNKNIIQNIYSWDQFFNIDENKSICSNFDLIIMAGGRGKRLAPFTNRYPKALMPIGGIPMILRILEKYFNYGFRKFHFSTNYRREILKKTILNEFVNLHSSSINFVDESKPLGTIGALKHLKLSKISENIVVTNCDTIVSENFDKIILNHINTKSDITMLITNKVVDIPYGEIKLDNNQNFLDIIEKPKYNFKINIGFYIINKRVVKLIPSHKSFDATDLILKAKKKKMKILTYTIPYENWIEIGKTSELEAFNKIFDNEH